MILESLLKYRCLIGSWGNWPNGEDGYEYMYLSKDFELIITDEFITNPDTYEEARRHSGFLPKEPRIVARGFVAVLAAAIIDGTAFFDELIYDLWDEYFSRVYSPCRKYWEYIAHMNDEMGAFNSSRDFIEQRWLDEYVDNHGLSRTNVLMARYMKALKHWRDNYEYHYPLENIRHDLRCGILLQDNTKLSYEGDSFVHITFSPKTSQRAIDYLFNMQKEAVACGISAYILNIAIYNHLLKRLNAPDTTVEDYINFAPDFVARQESLSIGIEPRPLYMDYLNESVATLTNEYKEDVDFSLLNSDKKRFDYCCKELICSEQMLESVDKLAKYLSFEQHLSVTRYRNGFYSYVESVSPGSIPDDDLCALEGLVGENYFDDRKITSDYLKAPKKSSRFYYKRGTGIVVCENKDMDVYDGVTIFPGLTGIVVLLYLNREFQRYIIEDFEYDFKNHEELKFELFDNILEEYSSFTANFDEDILENLQYDCTVFDDYLMYLHFKHWEVENIRDILLYLVRYVLETKIPVPVKNPLNLFAKEHTLAPYTITLLDVPSARPLYPNDEFKLSYLCYTPYRLYSEDEPQLHFSGFVETLFVCVSENTRWENILSIDPRNLFGGYSSLEISEDEDWIYEAICRHRCTFTQENLAFASPDYSADDIFEAHLIRACKGLATFFNMHPEYRRADYMGDRIYRFIFDNELSIAQHLSNVIEFKPLNLQVRCQITLYLGLFLIALADKYDLDKGYVRIRKTLEPLLTQLGEEGDIPPSMYYDDMPVIPIVSILGPLEQRLGYTQTPTSIPAPQPQSQETPLINQSIIEHSEGIGEEYTEVTSTPIESKLFRIDKSTLQACWEQFVEIITIAPKRGKQKVLTQMYRAAYNSYFNPNAFGHEELAKELNRLQKKFVFNKSDIDSCMKGKK